jgi:stearoyl-CoA desaturase (delta-9 desaturase)
VPDQWAVAAAHAIWYLHGGFVTFVIGGQAAILAGALFQWSWTRNPWLRLAHFAAMAVVAAEAMMNAQCVLTVWQDRLLAGAGRPPMGFHLFPYYVPDATLNRIYIAFGLVVLATLILVPPRIKAEHVFRSVFWAVQLSAVSVVLVPFQWSLVGVAAASHILRGLGLTLAFHRYYAHRAFQMGRGTRFFWTLLGTAALQKGPLWWAGHHVVHHRHADRDGDPHSPSRAGFYEAHVGWFLSDLRHRVDPANPVVREFSRYPEIRALERHCMLPPVLWAAAMYAIGGLPWLAWGFCFSTATIAHSTFAINSVNHLVGSRRFDTADESRNHPLTALVGLGEGWHNNHHRYQAAARNGFYWWEVDLTYYVICVMERLGLAWDVHRVPDRIYEEAASGSRVPRTTTASR